MNSSINQPETERDIFTVVSTRIEWLYALAEAIAIGNSGRVQPGAPIVSDDRQVGGGLMSEVALLSIGAGKDQLYEAAAVIRRSQEEGISLPLVALGTLIRGGLEAGATATWLLSPTSSRKRVQALVRLHLADNYDEDTFSSGHKEKGYQENRSRLLEIGRGAELSKSLMNKPLTSTAILAHASKVQQSQALQTWRLMSALAHARRWAIRVASDHEFVGYTENGREVMRLSANPEVLLVAFLEACGVLDYAVGRWNELSGNEGDNGLPLPPNDSRAREEKTNRTRLS